MISFGFILAPMKMAWYVISTFVMSKIICVPFIRRPFQRLDDPSYYGISNAINIRVPVELGQEMGAWFIRPYSENLVVGNSTENRWKSIKRPAEASSSDKEANIQRIRASSHATCDTTSQSLNCEADNLIESHCNMYLTEADETVILYLHGNAETRSQKHRRELYKKWQAQGLAVLAVDYRGYADSDGGFLFQTKESTMVWDGVIAFRFLKQYIHPKTKVIVWGHSLGTGVTTKLGNHKNYTRIVSIVAEPYNSESILGALQIHSVILV